MKRSSRWDIETINYAEHNAVIEKKQSGFISWLKRHSKKLTVIFLLCYIAIVIFGALTTRTYTDENGKRHSYRITFSSLKQEDDYELLIEKLTEVRKLLAEITVVDIHLANADISNHEAATLYSSILNKKLDILIPKVSSMNVGEEQKSIQDAIKSILANDLALYLQNITTALRTGDTKAVSVALTYREKALSTYKIIEDELKKLSSDLCKNDFGYYEWNLADATIKSDPTARLKTQGEQ